MSNRSHKVKLVKKIQTIIVVLNITACFCRWKESGDTSNTNIQDVTMVFATGNTSGQHLEIYSLII